MLTSEVVQQKRSAPSSTGERRERGAPMTRGKLLVVDDDPAVLEAYELALSLQGHELATADSGEAAVTLVRAADFDAVLTDFRMNGMDGLETMLAIKAMRPDVPVTIITGFASAEMEDECRRRGAFEIVRKPVVLDDLYAAVQRALERRKSDDARRAR